MDIPERTEIPQSWFDPLKPEYAGVVRFALLQQLPVLVTSASVLDFGRLFRMSLAATLVFWLLGMICLVSGQRKTDPSGVFFLRWGFLPLFGLIVWVAGFIPPQTER